MSSTIQNLKNVIGMIADVQMHKAIIAFGHEGKQEQALLKKEHLTVGGRHIQDVPLSDVLSVGTVIKFWCYRIPDMKSEDCAWFVTHAIKQDSCQDFEGKLAASAGVKQIAEFTPGLHRNCGTIMELTERHGVILDEDSPDEKGENRNVFFTASKLVLFGKPVQQNEKLPEVMRVGDPVEFDAIPMYPQQNFKSCKWFATLVWKGLRPIVRNAASAMPKEVSFKHLLTDGNNLQFVLYQIASDAKAMFVKTEGRIMFLINSEFGVAVLFMKQNILMSALFHRSVCYAAGHNLKNCDLQKVLKEGDHIKFVGVEAPPGLISKFVATHVVICRR